MCRTIYAWSTGTGQLVEGFFIVKECGREVVLLHWHRDEADREEATEIIIEGIIKRVRVV